MSEGELGIPYTCRMMMMMMDDDALTTEEELCLRQDTIVEFFLQQLKVLRESVVFF